jgi:hypothetical protein
MVGIAEWPEIASGTSYGLRKSYSPREMSLSVPTFIITISQEAQIGWLSLPQPFRVLAPVSGLDDALVSWTSDS